jgi:hypothetical protein
MFFSDHDITNLKPYVQAIVYGLPVDYSLLQTDACTSLLGRTCPLKKDEKVTYVLKLPILSVYPPVSTLLLDGQENTPTGGYVGRY